MNTPVDLRQLAFEPALRTPVPARHYRSLLTLYVLPLIILSGFVATVIWSLRDSLWRAKLVTVIPVIASRSEVAASNSPLFQAAGWVEPRPQAVVVSAMVEGIVDEVLVVEGQPVQANQVVARLVRRDAEIALQRAEADVRIRTAEILTAKARLKSAEALFAEPIVLLASVAEADATLAKVETELARLPALLRGAEARRVFSEKEVLGKSQMSGTVPAIAVRRAESELETALAQLDEYRQQKTSLERERIVLCKRRDALQRQSELKIDETRAVAEGLANVEVAEAHVQQATAVRDAARLALERTDVRAKTGGQVLALHARPGARLMGIDRAAMQDASTVLTMYDPRRLQVRADVRLDDVSRVVIGQQVRIETAAHAGDLTGRVLMATGLTDIQKNTLQVKLSIDDPPQVLKPDMLVQVTFMAPPRQPQEGSRPPLRLLAPRELIQNADSEATVWIADQSTGTAAQRRITLGTTTAGGLVEVTTGLNVGDRLIARGRDSLVDGERIHITDLDSNLGRESAGALKTGSQ